MTASQSPVAAGRAAIAESVRASIADRTSQASPYPHAFLERVFPDSVADALATLPFRAPSLEGLSGTREIHNDTRVYADAANMARLPVLAEVAHALQSPPVVAAFADAFGASLEGTYLRLEYAQDVDGFWLQPHTDLGVKKFTCLIYLSSDPGHEALGTDIYADKDTHVGRSPFRRNAAMVFVPSADTWHGFEARPFGGIRKSLILNYVTTDWRAREQLAFPEQLIRL